MYGASTDVYTCVCAFTCVDFDTHTHPHKHTNTHRKGGPFFIHSLGSVTLRSKEADILTMKIIDYLEVWHTINHDVMMT